MTIFFIMKLHFSISVELFPIHHISRSKKLALTGPTLQYWSDEPWYKALDPWIEINFIRDDGTRQLHNSRDMETAWGRKLVRLLGNAGGDTCRKPRLDNLLLRELHWSRIQPETAFLAVPRRIGHQGSLD